MCLREERVQVLHVGVRGRGVLGRSPRQRLDGDGRGAEAVLFRLETYSGIRGARSLEECAICPPGSSCASGAVAPTTCFPGSFAALHRTTRCSICEASRYQGESNATGCRACEKAAYCPAGSPKPVPCPPGTHSNLTSLSDASDCTDVVAGFWAPSGSVLLETCHGNSFYCPGKAFDMVSPFLLRGSKPFLLATEVVAETVTVVQQAISAIHTAI